ncbi:diaminobutyrate acetyltransferase [Reinekea sp. G2M2-21]|uniref:diaminobutyrate acetyltransferase n=1 Tax=Reinekea sp. G2M2-21 TaxID=2788942 RepID=UPI00351C01BD
MIHLQVPELSDGYEVYRLIQRCPPLDVNSAYCNLLQCGHFAQTSVIAKSGGQVVGFISGYVQPEQPDTLFVWQVAIDDSARGQGLATQMLEHLLARPNLTGIRYLETTITDDNQASWALFTRFAERRQVELSRSAYLDTMTHFNGEHDSERLVRIGPFNQ